MPLTLGWQEIALRLFLTLVAGTVIGLNRSEHGQAAGLRTTLLVCLAASVAMIQVNLLLVTRGKTLDNFNVLDLMRLPLGILSGMGFIGAGAILHKENLVVGVTTAATLWFVTVIGLCLGGGQLGLGMSAFALAVLILWGLKRFEFYLPKEYHAALNVMLDSVSGPPKEKVAGYLIDSGYKIMSSDLQVSDGGRCRQLTYQVTWIAQKISPQPPVFIDALAVTSGVMELSWKPRTGS